MTREELLHRFVAAEGSDWNFHSEGANRQALNLLYGFDDTDEQRQQRLPNALTALRDTFVVAGLVEREADTVTLLSQRLGLRRVDIPKKNVSQLSFRQRWDKLNSSHRDAIDNLVKDDLKLYEAAENLMNDRLGKSSS